MKRIIVTLLISITLATIIYAGPFGLEFGWSMEEMLDAGVEIIYPFPNQLEEFLTDEGYPEWLTFKIIPPSPSDYFKEYSVRFSHEYGLYEITATSGKDFIVNGTGTKALLSEDEASKIFDDVYHAMLLRYGSEGTYRAVGDSREWKLDDAPTLPRIELESSQVPIFNEGEGLSDVINGKARITDFYKGLYNVTLTYDMSEQLRALEDAKIF